VSKRELSGLRGAYLDGLVLALQEEVRGVLRREYLCSEERADKLSGAWAGHPPNGRMYLPAYRAGTEKVAELLRRHPQREVIPALFGARGLVDLALTG